MWYIETFFKLDTCRLVAQNGIQPIPWSAIQQMSALLGFDSAMAKEFERVIRVMDNHYLNFRLEQTKVRTSRGK